MVFQNASIILHSHQQCTKNYFEFFSFLSFLTIWYYVMLLIVVFIWVSTVIYEVERLSDLLDICNVFCNLPVQMVCPLFVAWACHWCAKSHKYSPWGEAIPDWLIFPSICTQLKLYLNGDYLVTTWDFAHKTAFSFLQCVFFILSHPFWSFLPQICRSNCKRFSRSLFGEVWFSVVLPC